MSIMNFPVSTKREQTLELNACVQTVAPKEVDEEPRYMCRVKQLMMTVFPVARLIEDKADASSTVNQSVM